MTRHALYILIVVCVAFAGVLGWEIRQVSTLREDLDTARVLTYDIRKSQNDGCVRGNVRRANERFILEQLEAIATVVSGNAATPKIANFFTKSLPEYRKRAADPSVQEQDCDLLYPVPKRPGE